MATDFLDPLVGVIVNVMNVLSVPLCLMASVMIYLVISKSPKLMGTYRIFLVAQFCGYITTHLLGELTKPIMLEPVPVIYSAGWLSHVSSDTFLFLFFAYYGSLVLGGVVYGCIVLERVFAVAFVQNRRKKLTVIFGVGSAVGMLMWIFVIYSWLNAGVFLSAEMATQILRTQVENGTKLLASRTALFAFDAGKVAMVSHVTLHVLLLLCSCCGLVPLALLFWIEKNGSHYTSVRTRQLNFMLLKAVSVQAIGFVILVLIPILLFMFGSLLLKSSIRVCQVTCLFVDGFIIYDMIVLIVILKPYRDALFRLLLRGKWLLVPQIPPAAHSHGCPS